MVKEVRKYSLAWPYRSKGHLLPTLLKGESHVFLRPVLSPRPRTEEQQRQPGPPRGLRGDRTRRQQPVPQGGRSRPCRRRPGRQAHPGCHPGHHAQGPEGRQVPVHDHGA